MLIVFVGPPGVGKGTQCALLRDRLKLTHLSTGEILRKAIEDSSELGEKAKSYIHEGKLVPDDVMIDMIDDRLFSTEAVADWLLDGFPRTLPQALALDALLAKQEAKINVVLELVADHEEVRSRLVQRAKDEGRSDDDPITVQRRLLIFIKQTAPIVEYYAKQGILKKIDGIGTPDEVHGRILKTLESVK